MSKRMPTHMCIHMYIHMSKCMPAHMSKRMCICGAEWDSNVTADRLFTLRYVAMHRHTMACLVTYTTIHHILHSTHRRGIRSLLCALIIGYRNVLFWLSVIATFHFGYWLSQHSIFYWPNSGFGNKTALLSKTTSPCQGNLCVTY